MRVRHAALSALVLLAAGGPTPGCAPTKATRLFVSTDALRVTPRLFHALRVEVRKNGVLCSECAREFPVDEATFPNDTASFDLEGEGSASVRLELVRVRGSAPPRASSTVTVVASLDLDGVPHAVSLPMDKAGRTLDLRADRVDAVPAPIPLSLPAPTRTCADASHADEVCIPGGHFWMGDPLMDILGLGDAVDGTLERIVTLDAFQLDRTEVTVGALRVSSLATDTDPVRASHAGCTYPMSPTDASRDELPVNCVTLSLAEAYCRARGASLPTEAEFEYVAGGLRSEAYVWGDAKLGCGDASVGLAACPLEEPRPVRSGSKDALTVAPGSTVFDIVGNVHELTQDLWNAEDGPCWGPGVFHNPRCVQKDPKLPRARVVRGGAFADLPVYASAALREFVEEPDVRVGTSIGFRCRR